MVVPLIEKRDPTHVLTISVPLNLTGTVAGEQDEYQRAVRDAVHLVLTLSRLADRGYLCADPTVEMSEQR